MQFFYFFKKYFIFKTTRGASPRGVEANVLDSDIRVSKFEFLLPYHVHFRTNTLGKCINPFISSSNILNIVTAVLLQYGYGIQ